MILSLSASWSVKDLAVSIISSNGSAGRQRE